MKKHKLFPFLVNIWQKKKIWHKREKKMNYKKRQTGHVART